jgi:hypothetical protein
MCLRYSLVLSNTNHPDEAGYIQSGHVISYMAFTSLRWMYPVSTVCSIASVFEVFFLFIEYKSFNVEYKLGEEEDCAEACWIFTYCRWRQRGMR